MEKEKPFLENPGMHKGANPSLFDNARRLRDRMTKAEILLWDRLKANSLATELDDNIQLEII